MNNITSEHFEKFWETSIYPAITKCLNDVDTEFFNKCNLITVDEQGYKQKLKNLYKRKREWLKREYLPHSSHPILDFHKLGSIVCRCMIGNKPFTYDIAKSEVMQKAINNDDKLSHKDKIDWLVSNIYINYKVSFLSAIGIVYADLVYWATKKCEDYDDSLFIVYKEFLEKLIARQNLFFYPSPIKHENFFNSTVIALMKEDILKRDYNYLLMSMILYQLQENTKLRLFEDILKKYNLNYSDVNLT